MEEDETCLMALESQDVNLNTSNFDNVLNIHGLQDSNDELIKINNDFVKTIKTLSKEKVFVEIKRIKFINKINRLELDANKVAMIQCITKVVSSFHGTLDFGL